jgi:hypothetical protein
MARAATDRAPFFPSGFKGAAENERAQRMSWKFAELPVEVAEVNGCSW